ncbi:MAG: heme exporter protein CcmD [Pseudomonadota bacterium]
MSWQQFIHMGGFGFYVWSAYGCVVAVVGGLILHSYYKFKKLRYKK